MQLVTTIMDGTDLENSLTLCFLKMKGSIDNPPFHFIKV